MKKIFFHIGLPKTGSSYLQSAFSINSNEYKKYGLIYENLHNNFDKAKLQFVTSGNGHGIANSLRNNIETSKHFKPFILSDLFGSFDKNYDHLISSETFSLVSLDSLKNIFNIASKNFKCTFIAFVRDPVKSVISSYLQQLKTINKNSASFDISYPNSVLSLKHMHNLLVGLRPHIKLFNYDFKKNNLIDCFDDFIFGKLISMHPEKKIINPSLNYQQSEVIRLLRKLDINLTKDEVIKYIEDSKKYKEKIEEFPISKSICEKIYKDLSVEIKEINRMLPDDQQIIPTCENYSDMEYVSLFTNNDIDFLKKKIRNSTSRLSISSKECLLLNKKLSPYSLSPELPADFNILDYLLLNPDVLRSNVDPVEHYLIHGKEENRQYNKEFIKTKTANLNFDRSTAPDSRIRRIIKRLVIKFKLISLKLKLIFK